MRYLKKITKVFNVVVLIIGILVPAVLFVNRFLIPDNSFDSINYHMYLGFKGLNWQNNQFEFYPTGLHNFSPLLDITGYVLMKILGYRLGSIASLIFLYLSIFVLYKIFRLYSPKTKVLSKWWFGLMFVNMFLSFESFLQVATYYTDIEVAFLMLLSTYFLMKYEKTKRLIDLVLSSFVVSVFVLGKMTTWYYLFPYFVYLLMILLSDKKLKAMQKFLRFCLSGTISVLLVMPWLFQNFNLTGNPVFPFYNGVFKSKYFIIDNFSQSVFGGKNLFEKLFYGIVSAQNPVRLGEVHDLFTDYRISIFFVTSILVLIWAIYKKDKVVLKLSVFYLALYLCWSFAFGYLRYGLVLEFLGGLLLLIWFDKMRSVRKYLLIVPIVLLMLVQGKRIINMSLAYDISFRQGYFYNRQNYLKEIVNLNNNKIKIDDRIVNKYAPNVFVNCVTPGMTYFTMSEFSNLPVLTIDSKVYGGMVLNSEYNKVVDAKLKKYLDNNKFRFVTITTKEGLHNRYSECINNLKDKKFTVLDELTVNSFLGYSDQKLVVIFGEFVL